MGKPMYRRSNKDLNDSQLIAMTSAHANAIAIAQATALAIGSGHGSAVTARVD